MAPSATTPTVSTHIDNYNRLALAGMGYDNTGNLTSISGAAYAYDAEGRQTTATVGGAVTRYYYDGEGNRVKKLNPSNQATVYVYGVSGNLVSEYAPETVTGGSTRYVSPDYLGSTRMITGSAGQALARYDYQSFVSGNGGTSGVRFGFVC